MRASLYAEIDNFETEYQTTILHACESTSNLHILIGKVPNDAQPELVFKM